MEHMPHQGVLHAIDHVGIAVHDLDTAVLTYTRTYGMSVLHEEVNEEQQVREVMLSPGDGGGPAVQLLTPTSDDSPVARFLARKGEGMHHVAYAVQNIAAASAQLRGRGVELLYPMPRQGTCGSRVNFIHPKNAGGVLMELVEHVDGGTEEGADNGREDLGT